MNDDYEDNCEDGDNDDQHDEDLGGDEEEDEDGEEDDEGGGGHRGSGVVGRTKWRMGTGKTSRHHWTCSKLTNQNKKQQVQGV